MPLLSRFRKGEKPEDGVEEAIENLDDSEEEGLLMSTGGQQAVSAGAEKAGQAGALNVPEAPEGEAAGDPEEAAQRGAESDDLLEAAGGGAATSDASSAPDNAAPPADPLEPSGGEQLGPQAEAAEEQSGPGDSSDGPDDDPLAAFRDSKVETEMSDLTNDIEDVPMDELMAELREVLLQLLEPRAADNGEA